MGEIMEGTRVAIIKVRGSQDVEFRMPLLAEKALPFVGASGMLEKMAATRGQVFLPNMVLPYLAALCQAHDRHAGTVHEYMIVDESEDELRKWDWDVDLAMFTVSTTNCQASYRMADLARSWGVKTVLGGIHPSTLPEEAAPHADAIAIGEAETVIDSIIDDFDAGRLARTYEGGRARSLAGLPVPAWDLGVTSVTGHGGTRPGSTRDYAPWVIPVQTSRGCRNACRFCSTTRYQGADRRHRPIEDIVNEIKTLQANGILTPRHTVFFTDNNIVSDSDHHAGTRDTAYARSLFSALIPLGITWVGQGEITVGEDEDFVDLMSRSGCHMLLIGMEAVSGARLAALGKGAMNAETYGRSLDVLHDHGIANIGCFIMGLDGQGIDEFRATERFIEKYVDVPQISILTPYPGTALYRHMEKERRILSRDWSMYDISHVVIRPDRMTPAELEDTYAAMLGRVYSWKNMVARAARYAMRSTRNGMPAFGTAARFSSVFAPNIVYRSLYKVARGLPSDIFTGAGSPVNANRFSKFATATAAA